MALSDSFQHHWTIGEKSLKNGNAHVQSKDLVLKWPKRRKLVLVYQKVCETLGAVVSLAGHSGKIGSLLDGSRVQTEQDWCGMIDRGVRLREKWLGLDWRQNAENEGWEFLCANHLTGSVGGSLSWMCAQRMRGSGYSIYHGKLIDTRSVLVLSMVKLGTGCPLELQNLCPCKCSELDWPRP